jgi:hypothetical protein
VCRSGTDWSSCKDLQIRERIRFASLNSLPRQKRSTLQVSEKSYHSTCAATRGGLAQEVSCQRTCYHRRGGKF